MHGMINLLTGSEALKQFPTLALAECAFTLSIPVTQQVALLYFLASMFTADPLFYFVFLRALLSKLPVLTTAVATDLTQKTQARLVYNVLLYTF